MRLEWAPREVPLTPCAVAAWGDAARALGQRTLDLPDEELAGIEGAASPECLVLVQVRGGPALPWVDGVEYLGRDPEARGLFLPTALAPNLSTALVVQSLCRRGLELPLALLVRSRRATISLAASRTIDRVRLAGWVGGRP